ncbi:MAG: RNA polymerase factor sigma-54 [Treponema sp.]|nr:RNA polymerase factor sigma-54 [Treponema sp.]
MPDFPNMRMQQKVSQNMSQSQVQKMSQTQIMSLNMLAMSGADLREEIYSYAAKNPALEIKSDRLEAGVSSSRTEFSNSSRFSDNTRYGSVSASGELASDNFQAALENASDERESLSDHLEHQLNAMNIPDEEKSMCRKLIFNLDRKGFHILAPVSFLESSNPLHTEGFLNKCLCLVQNLDPVGTCTNNYVESLFVQAKLSGLASDLTLFLLESYEHFDFLNPPQPKKIQKKISDYLTNQKKLEYKNDDTESEKFPLTKEDFTEEEIVISLNFIKTLDPYPARNFGSRETNFISPDVIVKRNKEFDSENETEFTVSFAREFLPKLSISKDYEKIIKEAGEKSSDGSEQSEKTKSELKFARNSVNEAKVFIDSVFFRENTILKAAEEIVKVQAEFFRKGTRFLSPLRQKDIAAKLGVHETTISRMASSKYISCEWGIFPVSYFFTNAAGGTPSPDTAAAEGSGKPGENQALSKESVKYVISEILKEHKDDKKPLSDQKISDILSAKGIKIARRTVAKYRSELNINSSYER